LQAKVLGMDRLPGVGWSWPAPRQARSLGVELVETLAANVELGPIDLNGQVSFRRNHWHEAAGKWIPEACV
jgi:hypothetical protein